MNLQIYYQMKPNPQFISIKDNAKQIKQLITELILTPRLQALKWSKKTDQTPNIKIGYPGQHLASVILGMKGTKTGARGNDIIDGTEVKSCSRVDALDKCRKCKSKVSRHEQVCPICKSTNIARDNTSKWLFTIRSLNDLKTLTESVNRVLLIIFDYPKFEEGNYEQIRIQAFEIWNNTEKCKRFKEIMTNYYNNIYLAQKKAHPTKTPAPKNFWPYSYQFYLCNPINIFTCIINDANNKPTLKITKYIKPCTDRSTISPEKMPISLLNQSELEILCKPENKHVLLQEINEEQYEALIKAIKSKDKEKISTSLPFIGETTKLLLPLREDTTFDIKTTYIRS